MSRKNVGKQLERVFWGSVEKTDTCWIWRGGFNSDGYGQVKVLGQSKKAHHVAFFLTFGRWPVQRLLHHCDNTFCVRPEHTYEGTQSENMIDASKRQRHGMLKLTDEQVLAAKAEYERGDVTLHELGRKYGCTDSSLSLLFRGKSRPHLTVKPEKE